MPFYLQASKFVHRAQKFLSESHVEELRLSMMVFPSQIPTLFLVNIIS